MFLDEHDHENGQKRQKTGNFSDRLNHSDVVAVQTGYFDGEIVKQRVARSVIPWLSQMVNTIRNRYIGFFFGLLGWYS